MIFRQMKSGTRLRVLVVIVLSTCFCKFLEVVFENEKIQHLLSEIPVLFWKGIDHFKFSEQLSVLNQKLTGAFIVKS